MLRLTRVMAVLAIGLFSLGAVGNAFAAGASNDNAKLVHVGLNPATCGTVPGTDSGVVVAHFNVQQSREALNVSVHDALPNTTYVVDIRCVGAVGNLTTNAQGTGTAQIDMSVTTAPGTFYVDISVAGGGGGAGGYGDTFIAGPLTLN